MNSLIKPLFCAALISASIQASAESCRGIPQKDDMHAQTVCMHANSNIEKAYKATLKSSTEEAKFLRKTLPKERVTDSNASTGGPTVTYQPINASKYKITLSYDGGETEWTLLKSNKHTKIIFDYYPD